MLKQRSNTIAALDIGSSKVVCLIGKVGTKEILEVIGIGHNVSSGIKAGIITDLKSAVSSMVQAIESAEYMADERMQRLYVSLSSNNLLSQRSYSDLSVTGHEINSKDIHKLLMQVLERYPNQELEVLHSFVYDYILDGNRGITTPLGMYGNKLACDLHVLATPAVTAMNITNCLAKCQLEVQGYIASSYATGLACLTADEMRLGVTLIEFGAGCTSISVFYNGQLVYTDGVPIGGQHITSDIAKGLCLDLATAERIKNLYGTVIFTTDNNKEIVEISPLPSEENENIVVSRALLVEIIRSRVDEIIELIKRKADDNKFDLHNNKIVITGGGAKLNGLKELLSYIFATKVRIGHPHNAYGAKENFKDVEFTTAIGMLEFAAEHLKSNFHFNASKQTSSKVLQWLKDLWT